ncbi:MAG: sulfoxide reductase heme-binding subunit YedZ, partial [Gammaproteobacteria bacterium]
YWMRAGKNDFAEVVVYAVLLAALLGWRVWHRVQQRRKAPAPVQASGLH